MDPLVERFFHVVDKLIELKKVKSSRQLALSIDLSPPQLTFAKKGERDIPMKYIDEMCEKYFVNKKYIVLNEGEMFLPGMKLSNPRIEAEPLHLSADPNDYDNDGSKFEELGDGTLRMRVPIVPAKAYAGYMRGWQDPEYYSDMDTISIDVHKRHSGDYMAFEVKGDSMETSEPSKMRSNIYEGWIVVGRDLSRHQWQYKLHTHNYDAWVIVHKTEGILIKEIVAHDVENSMITIHSLNPKYEDEVLSLNDIEQIFSVVQIINKR
ncbi:S24 family peptidase [Pedobacter jejuensis]|uniref:Uncharacterized protein n=1 Tax=Pedobacter jejuensis TaxID=1268550 RepID=A0A3N0BVN8_9SPHI|nr:S24 family peptidase [Pedobacter jejuensis]RNL53765.1 hypothetical protein D7004_09515 [Pedobacter jejuensis]